VLLLAALTIACLAPFAGKAFHIDDPLFLWVARQIGTHPFDPYGFQVNWYGAPRPMSETMWNPPLNGYFIALATLLLGWSEIALHLAFLVPATAVVLGTYFLARELCARPTLAALAALLTPVFLVSSSTVMCDTLTLAFWVWAGALWVRGMETGRRSLLPLAALLASAAVLTKYNAVSLIPLLFVYSLVKRRSLGAWALYLAIPVAILGLYVWAASAQQGGTFLANIRYSMGAETVKKPGIAAQTLIALSETGGCLAVALFFIPLLWSRRTLAIGGAVGLAAVLLATSVEKIGRFPLYFGEQVRWLFIVQFVVWAIVGVNLVVLAGSDLIRRRDPGAVLLSLWLVGTFVFAGFVSWSASARYILPIAPAAGILLMRRLEDRRVQAGWWYAVPLILAALLALFVAGSDYVLANTGRRAATMIHKKYGAGPGTLWFQGHWGFQYYMESLGAKAVNMERPEFQTGDIVVIPENNANTFAFRAGVAPLVETVELPACRWLTTMSRNFSAGFYADVYGPIPFAFGSVPPERYYVYTIPGRSASPKGAIEHYKAGLELEKQGKADDAIHEYREAIRLQPRNAQAHHNLAVVLYFKGKYAEAWEEVHMSEDLGLEVRPAFRGALSQAMAEPLASTFLLRGRGN
jgi:4-amino-4-deoxy-L-arabinose transferase-like glycosyltransferase